MSSDTVHSDRRGSSGNSPLRRSTANAPARKDSADSQNSNTVKVKGLNKLPSQARMEAAVQRRKEREKEEEEKRKQGELTGSDRRASGAATPPQRFSSIDASDPLNSLGTQGGKPNLHRRAAKPSTTKDVLRAYTSTIQDKDSSYAMQNRPERPKRPKGKDSAEEDEHLTAEEKFAAGREVVSAHRAQMGNDSNDTEPPNPYGTGIPRSSSPKPMKGNHSRTNSQATLDTHSGHGPSKEQEHGRNGSVSSVSSVVKERRDSNVSIKSPTIPASIPQHMREDSLTGRPRRLGRFVELDDEDIEKLKEQNKYIPPPDTSRPHSSPSRADRASISSASQSSTRLNSSASTLRDGEKARKLTGQTGEGERPKRQKGKKGKKDKNDAAR